MSLGRFSERDTSIENHRLALAVEGAATGPDLRFSGVEGRRERDGQWFPFCQIATANMTPIFWPVPIAEWMQLIKKVVVVQVIDRAVRIIHPMRGSRKVKNGA